MISESKADLEMRNAAKPVRAQTAPGQTWIPWDEIGELIRATFTGEPGASVKVCLEPLESWLATVRRANSLKYIYNQFNICRCRQPPLGGAMMVCRAHHSLAW
jgi:hypothetical protein